MPEWTDEQRDAINHPDGGAVVSASAGSGKTAVLSERVVRLITEKNIDPAKLAVVTFTEKAAAELKTRLNRRMREYTAAHPENADFLRRQTAKLQNAKISTISSFCFGLLRDNANLTDLSAGFSVMEELRTDILKRTVLDGVLDDFYLAAGEDELDIIRDYFIGRDDRELAELILKIYGQCVNIPDYDEWLDGMMSEEFIDRLHTQACTTQKSAADTALADFDKFKAAAADEPEKLHKYIAKLEESIAAALRLIKENGSASREEISALTAKAPSRAESCKSDEVKKLRDIFRGHANDAIDLAEKLADFETDTRRYFPVQKVLIKLTKEFADRYYKEKRSLNVADFADGEQEVYKLLKNHPEVAQLAAFEYIIVDEFQDSNEIQYEIFRRLSDDEKNLYFVGDIKQSIYSFRGAQPEVFSAVSKSEKYTLLPLNSNFRSRQNVIDGINAIFDRIMTEKLGGADYKQNSRLVCSRKDEFNDGDITEIIAVVPQKGADGHTAEAEYVAKRIRQMIDSGYLVKGKPCTEDDFAILMRATKSRTGKYLDALKAQGLNGSAASDESFTERPEIRLMTDYLTVLDDPYNDASLARLLMSAVFGFDAEKMSRIRTGTCGVADIDGLRAQCGDELYRYCDEYVKKPLFSCVTAAAGGGFAPDAEKYPALAKACADGQFGITDKPDAKCAEFINELYRLRGFMAGSSPAALIQKIYDTTQVKNLLMLCHDPETRAANLRALVSVAKECADHGGMLSDFLHHLADTAQSGSKLKSTAPQAGGVKVMSIHASKGLQFPICFVCGCSSQFNVEEVRHNVIVSKKYGIAGKITDREMMIRRPSPSFLFAKEELRAQQHSEEMRLLYVAATRAEEKLIFTGSAKVFTNSYMGWMTAAGADADPLDYKNPSGTTCFDGKVKFTCVEQDADCGYETEDSAESAAADTEKAQLIARQLEYKYPAAALTKIAAKYTATQLVQNRRVQQGSSEYCELYISRPAFLGKNGKLSGKQRGDAYHKAMQYLPMDRPLDGQAAKAELDKLAVSGILTDKERECIEPSDIAKFYQTEQAQRMIKSGDIYREQPIFHKLDMSKLTARELGISEEDKASADGAQPYVQGIADLFFIEDGKIILIDYKSDSFSDEDKLISDYGFQLEIYADALEQMYGMPVTEKYIYSFRLGKMISVEKE
ncbi:MAG: UvrD-helicase domain-containing protein [Eubacterium sp.]|nr:UvrD-helicase domain-containing protein [Eubacterium sp.]